MNPYRSCLPIRDERLRLVPISRLVLAYGLLAAITGCDFTKAERQQIAREGVLIGVCKSEASECGKREGAPEKLAPQCWAVFDACLLDAGITVTNAKDGGR